MYVISSWYKTKLFCIIPRLFLIRISWNYPLQTVTKSERMEDKEFFHYARFFLKPQGYSLDVNGNSLKFRLWASFVLIVQEIVLALVAIDSYFKYPDIEPMITTVAVTFGLLVNSFKIGTVHFKIKKFSIFLTEMMGLWKIRK